MNAFRKFSVIALTAMAAVAVAEQEHTTATTVVRSQDLLLAQAPQPAQGQPPPPATPEQRVAMLKQWLQASQAQLRKYEWVETTVITKDGEEKSRQQNTCYYGADGKLQKVPAASGSDAKSGGPPGVLPPGRLLKKASEKKKEELVAYMKKAAALMQSYVPPEANRIQQAVNAGKFSISPGQRVRLDFKDYLKAGDVLSIEIEGPTNRLLGMAVTSYLDTAKDEVRLNVGMGVLPDGTLYTSRTTLDAIAEGVVVTIENTGHRQTGR